eukprot:CAMPEP_0178974122 /NCGR_PEP_ID=MMETSP0789-20121207/22234_1 /TAXON_ID=3005 /ORGANISM="Rhizosolenia setigera, Strain CCMP 1694" /LENGTH=408 /DNA_ID=CAMNT_0020662327 /DNA_START=774 /DNA_END=2000 /DNA_ORIENTATION=-
MKQVAHTLTVASTGLFKTVARVLEEDCCCCSDNDNGSDDDGSDDNGAAGDTDADDSPSPSTNSSPTPVPSISASPTYDEKKLVASDGENSDLFGWACSVTDDFVVIGASDKGAAHLFRLDGTQVRKLTLDNVFKFGISVSIDEKVVVGSTGRSLAIYSLEGIIERTLSCSADECEGLGNSVATYGDRIVTFKSTSSSEAKSVIVIYTTAGDVLKEIKLDDGGAERSVASVDISAQYIVASGLQTTVYSNEAPDFPVISEFHNLNDEQQQKTVKAETPLIKVAVAGDRVVLGDRDANDSNGGAWLYNVDGTLVKELDRQDSASNSFFGWDVGITDEKVFVGAPMDSETLGNVFVYSAATGDFIEKIASPDGVAGSLFGSCMDFSDNSDVIGAAGENSFTGAAYVMNIPS